MKSLNIKQLDEKDEEFAEALINLGMNRNVARTLAYLRNVSKTTAIELEKGAQLHQPEVSVAMKELKERDWIIEWEQKKTQGKGRPFKIYSLKVGADKIIADFEKKRNKDAEITLSRIKRLKELKQRKPVSS
jgi:predicted transcriptional regulator